MQLRHEKAELEPTEHFRLHALAIKLMKHLLDREWWDDLDQEGIDEMLAIFNAALTEAYEEGTRVR